MMAAMAGAKKGKKKWTKGKMKEKLMNEVRAAPELWRRRSVEFVTDHLLWRAH